MNGHLCTPMLSISKLWAEVLPVLVRGCVAWRLQADVLSKVSSTIVRMTCVMMYARCVAGKTWISWHRLIGLAASAQILATWGTDAITAVLTCAVGAMARLAVRPVCSGRVCPPLEVGR